MNINSIKALSWIVSASLTAGVLYSVWDFYEHPEILGPRISAVEAKRILDSAEIPEGPLSSLVTVAAIERAYYYEPKNRSLANLLDWTGAPPRKVIDQPKQDSTPKPVARKLVADVITIALVQESLTSPDRSKAWIKYKPNSGVTTKPDAFPSVVMIGDVLPRPLDYATVKAMTALDGITFSFEGLEFEDETVPYKTFETGVDIYVVGEGNPEVVPTAQAMPALDVSLWRPERTTAFGQDQFRIGFEDARDFSDDFAGIIAREVRHSRHYNAKLGKYDGIELKTVKPGGKIAGHGGQSGDIIKSINGHAVSSSSEAISFVKNNKDKYDKWIVVVENKGKQRTMTFESPPEE
ncbi:MAG: hypothetical protein ACI9F9_003189 [Candidatus Paceibacteria bacterium]|jgi:hypothetical protein